MKKKLLCLLSVFCCLFLLIGCGMKKPAEDVKISLSKTSLELTVGSSEELTVSIDPADAMDKTVIWKSADESIAVVDGGKVTAKAVGETKITAESNGKTATCNVVVKEP